MDLLDQESLVPATVMNRFAKITLFKGKDSQHIYIDDCFVLMHRASISHLYVDMVII